MEYQKPNQENNLAFVDGQNLYMGTRGTDSPWTVDLVRFRIYLEKKYHVQKAYFASSLYKSLGSHYFDYLDQIGVKIKIIKEKGSVGS